jgi:hypothetical protein
MNSSARNVRPVLGGWVLLGLLLSHLPLFGQGSGYAPAPTDSPRTDGAYWRVKTQAAGDPAAGDPAAGDPAAGGPPAGRRTSVRFYDAQHRLFYEEFLPGRWIRLTRRNRRQLDVLLDQLLSNQLLAPRLKTTTLYPDRLEPRPPLVRTPARRTISGTLPSSTLTTHAYFNAEGKLWVKVDNPGYERYVIEMIDSRGRVLYQEFTNHDRYRRRMDVAGLGSEPHRLVIRGLGPPAVYQVSRSSVQPTYAIERWGEAVAQP